MASIYGLKTSFQNLLRPVSNKLAEVGATANQVTLAALSISMATGGAIALWPDKRGLLCFVPPVLFLRMALNALDGMLAREHNMQSPLGAFLNELGDVFSDLALYLPFALVPGVSPVLVTGVVLLSVISEMTGVVAVQIGAGRRYDGPMGKSDRAFIFGVLSVLILLGIGKIWIDSVLSITILLLMVTIFNRASNALKEVKHGTKYQISNNK